MRTPCLSLLVLFGASAGADEPSIPFEKYTLPNGLTVILSEDHRLPQVAVDVWYHVGAANQVPGKSGFAHLFEHMMFAGSEHSPKQTITVLEAIGATGMNGTTSFDRTNYFEAVPSEQVGTALWLESDRMGFLLPAIDAQKLKIQRDVVSNERRQSYENRPYGLAQLELWDLLYPKPHPYYDGVIGTIEEIQSASLEDLQAFFRQFYTPRNASLAIVGDFDPAVVKRLVARYFGPLPGGPTPTRPDIPQPMLTGVVERRVEDRLARVPRLTLAWNGVKPYGPEEPAGDVLAQLLANTRTSRLYRTLVEGKQTAAGVSASNAALGLGGYFELTVTPKENHTVAELRPEVQAVLDDIKAGGVSPAEVERAKRNLVAGLYRSVERIGGFGGKADRLNEYQTFLGDPGWLGRDIARYEAVTPEQVQAFARKYLPDDRRIILEVVPVATTAAHGGGR